MSNLTAIAIIVSHVCVVTCAWMLYRTSGRLVQIFSEIRELVVEAKNQSVHSSDCAVHSEPAYPAGPCDRVDAEVERFRKLAL